MQTPSILQRVFRLLSEALSQNQITPTDIYDFYYITYVYQMDPSVLQDSFKKDVIETELNRIKSHYLAEFIPLFQKQLKKYSERNRVDKTFNSGKINSNDLQELLALMKATYRSDMSRRNERWEKIIEHLIALNTTQDIPSMISTIDRINNLTHNTETQVLDKLANSHSILKAFNEAHKAKPEFLRTKTSADVRNL